MEEMETEKVNPRSAQHSVDIRDSRASSESQGLSILQSTDMNNSMSFSADGVALTPGGVTPQMAQISITGERVQTMLEFLEEMKLQMRPEDYVTKSNSDGVKLSDKVFVFTVTMNPQTWILRKRIVDFVALDKHMKKTTVDVDIQSIVKSMRALRDDESSTNYSYSRVLDQLTMYLQQSPMNDSLQEFLEISNIDHQGHQKFKECFMKKRAGGRTNESRCVRCGVFWGVWNKRYLCITSDGISISNGRKGKSSEVRQMVMMSYNFSVEYGMQQTGLRHGIVINSSNRKLTLEAHGLFEFFDFLKALKDAMKASPYLGLHRFASFSPIRDDNSCKWYVDGESYFSDVAKYIRLATRELFITDWWLSPQFHLTRPVENSSGSTTIPTPSNRIDLLLKEKAERDNVKVFIIVYKEPTLALTINSNFTKIALRGMHPNIKVLRHPSTLIPFMWSHHEKMVVIDQKIAFLGGLDICYGRMDNSSHLLYDNQDEAHPQQPYWPGIDYCNSRTKDFTNVSNFNRSDIDRTKDPRMPWHDVAMRIVGDGVIDVSRHFIQYWNFALTAKQHGKGKESQIVLRMRQDSSQSEDEDEAMSAQGSSSLNKSGFIGKIKRKWRDFRGSHIPPAQQANDLAKPLIIEEDRDIDERGGGGISAQGGDQDDESDDSLQVFERQIGGTTQLKVRNQNQLYFDQLARQSFTSAAASSQGFRFASERPRKAVSKPEEAEEERKEDSNGRKNNKNNESNHPRRRSKEIGLSTNEASLNTYQSLQRIRSQSLCHSNGQLPFADSQLDSAFFDLLQNIRKANVEEADESGGYYLKDKKRGKKYQQEQQSQEKKSKKKDNQGIFPKLKRSSASKDSSRSNSPQSSMNVFEQLLSSEPAEIILNNKRAGVSTKGQAQSQMVRSSALWSCGVKETEYSIYVAYIQLIGQAEHFIYIENQFFISGLAGAPVRNEIASALVSRIKQAHQQNKQFHVIVVLPLLPGFEGEIDGDAAVLKIQLHWQYNTISRGGNSIYQTLQKEGIDPAEYISFFGLRTHAWKKPNQPVSEIVYVHSKLIIIDDRVALIGSANINDRSMLGGRDSEIAMVVEDRENVESVMRGFEYTAGKFAHTLRVALFEEHFGLDKQKVIDPLNLDFLSTIHSNAKRNTEIYREVFRCYPDDEIKHSEKWSEFRSMRNLELYQEKISSVVGFAVQFPMRFLENEDLRLRITQKEYFVPDINFT